MNLGTKIRETRENKGITLRKLAKEIGVSPSFISQVEQSKANPSVDSLKQIASILGVSCSYLIGEETSATTEVTSETPSSVKNRFDQELFHDIQIKRLVPDSTQNDMEPCLLTFAPGGYSNEDLYHPNGEEFMLILSGQLSIKLNGKEYTLKEGDNIFFNALVKHSLRNKSTQATKVLWIKNS